MSDKLAALYANRFDDAERAWKQDVWRVLWTRVLSRWVGDADTLVDLGAGYCEFINHAVARRRIAVDLNPDTANSAAAGVEVRSASADFCNARHRRVSSFSPVAMAFTATAAK